MPIEGQTRCSEVEHTASLIELKGPSRALRPAGAKVVGVRLRT